MGLKTYEIAYAKADQATKAAKNAKAYADDAQERANNAWTSANEAYEVAFEELIADGKDEADAEITLKGVEADLNK